MQVFMQSEETTSLRRCCESLCRAVSCDIELELSTASAAHDDKFENILLLK